MVEKSNATDKPLCKICVPERRHGRGEPHVFGKLLKPRSVGKATVSQTVVTTRAKVAKAIATEIATVPGLKISAKTESAIEDHLAILEAYKAAERAKVLARVHKHRAARKSKREIGP